MNDNSREVDGITRRTRHLSESSEFINSISSSVDSMETFPNLALILAQVKANAAILACSYRAQSSIRLAAKMWSGRVTLCVCIGTVLLCLVAIALPEKGVCDAENCNSFEEQRQFEEAPQQNHPNDHIRSTGMEWRSSGRDNDDLVTQLKRGNIIKDERVEQAMRQVDRGHFSPSNPYQDSPQVIGYGVTISAPHMHAHALEVLKDKLQEGVRALDVGSGELSCIACAAKFRFRQI